MDGIASVFKHGGWPRRLIFVMGFLLLAGLSCRLPLLNQTPQEGGERVEESIAGTLTAQPANQNDQGPTATSPPPSVTASLTAVPSTQTPSVTPIKTNTPTPEGARVHVTGDTFCRFGPGEVYEALGIMNTDQEAEIIAKNSGGTFWFIVNPDDPDIRCWIWGNYATPEGPTGPLPVYTPPPTPTPSAKISASYNYVCGSWYFDFKVTNLGSVPFESYEITLTDTNSGARATTQVNVWPGGCTGGGPDVLGPGQNGRAYAEFLKNNPVGHQMQATLTACSKENLGGTCATTNFSFTATN